MRVTDLRTMFTIDLQAERDKHNAGPDEVVGMVCFIGLPLTAAGTRGTLYIYPDLTVYTDRPDDWRAVVQGGKVIGIIYPNNPDDQPWNSTIPAEWAGLPGTEGLL